MLVEDTVEDVETLSWLSWADTIPGQSLACYQHVAAVVCGDVAPQHSKPDTVLVGRGEGRGGAFSSSRRACCEPGFFGGNRVGAARKIWISSERALCHGSAVGKSWQASLGMAKWLLCNCTGSGLPALDLVLLMDSLGVSWLSPLGCGSCVDICSLKSLMMDPASHCFHSLAGV